MAREATRRFALSFPQSMLDHVAAVANARGLTSAAYIRTATADALRRDALVEAPARAYENGRHLSGEDILRLDAACRELGVDLAAAVK